MVTDREEDSKRGSVKIGRRTIAWEVDDRGCHICTSHQRNKAGYARTTRREEGKQFGLYIHRLMFEVTHGPIPEGLVVRHRCDNPPCINPEHLESGTHLDNARDYVERGRSRRGKACANTRFTDAQVTEMRTSAEPYVVLAARYGTSASVISQIRTGKRRPYHPTPVPPHRRGNGKLGATGVRGVWLQADRPRPYVAAIWRAGQRVRLGTFSTLAEAAAAVERANAGGQR